MRKERFYTTTMGLLLPHSTVVQYRPMGRRRRRRKRGREMQRLMMPPKWWGRRREDERGERDAGGIGKKIFNEIFSIFAEKK